MAKTNTFDPNDISTWPTFLTISQAALTGLASDRMLRKMAKQGDIVAVKIGSDWRLPKDAFMRDFKLA